MAANRSYAGRWSDKAWSTNGPPKRSDDVRKDEVEGGSYSPSMDRKGQERSLIGVRFVVGGGLLVFAFVFREVKDPRMTRIKGRDVCEKHASIRCQSS